MAGALKKLAAADALRDGGLLLALAGDAAFIGPVVSEAISANVQAVGIFVFVVGAVWGLYKMATM